jgi:hypothetical protein
LQDAGRRLDMLINLATHPGNESCPTSLDHAVTRESASA